MTTLVDSVAQRISGQVSELTGKIEGILALASLIAAGAMPQREVCAFVVPLGFDDKGGEAATGFHTQVLSHGIGVLLCIKALGDAKARKALPTIEDLTANVVDAVAGWGPEGAVGLFSVTRGRLLSADKGLVIYQLDFALLDQLRITS